MNLRHRPLERRDFEACVGLLRERLAYPAEILARLPEAWRRLLADEAIISAVVEDLARPAASRIVAFGTSLFVTEAFMREACQGREPYLNARLIAHELDGKSPVLRPPEIRRGNSGNGLDLIVLHYSEERERLTPEERQQVRYRALEGFVVSHRGYRLKEMLQEYWDEIELPYILNGWGLLRTDYAEYFRRRGLPLPPSDMRPYLVGLSRAEALIDPGRLAAPLFVYTPPRFFFSAGEQRLLRSALLDAANEELARSLRIAMPTVKGRWRAIYDRVSAIDPEMLSESGVADVPGARRGKEKRRRLLEYIRQHPEELRPHLRPRSRCSAAFLPWTTMKSAGPGPAAAGAPAGAQRPGRSVSSTRSSGRNPPPTERGRMQT
jgi:hypothetical protein